MLQYLVTQSYCAHYSAMRLLVSLAFALLHKNVLVVSSYWPMCYNIDNALTHRSTILAL